MSVMQQMKESQKLLLHLLYMDGGTLDQFLHESASAQDVEQRPEQVPEAEWLRNRLANELFVLEHYASRLRDRLGIPVTEVNSVEVNLTAVNADSECPPS